MLEPHRLGRTYRSYMGAMSGRVLLTYRSLRHIQKSHAYEIGLGLLDHITDAIARPDYIFRSQWGDSVRDIFQAANIEFNGHKHYTTVVCSKPYGCAIRYVVTAYYTSKRPAGACLYKSASAE